MKSNARFYSIPYIRLTAVVLFAAALVVGAVYLACHEKNFGVALQPGMVITSDQGQITVEKIDLAPEPGDLSSQAEYDRLIARQDQLAKILNTETIVVSDQQGQSEYKAKQRSVGDLPVLFWIQVFVAFAAIFISGFIWAIKPKHLPTLFFFISGISLGLSAMSSAVYTTRLIAIPSQLFKPLSLINAVSAPVFGIVMIGLFLIYPLELRHWKKLLGITALLFSLLTLACAKKWFGLAMPHITWLIFASILLLALAVASQFFASRNDPKARAILLWLGLSVLVGCGLFSVLNTVPLLLGSEPLEQGYAFLALLFVYAGIAFGLKQFRLFEVGEWAYRFLFYAVGTLLLVLIDAALIFSAGMSRLPALGIALSIVSFLYLPLRDYFWRSFGRRKELQPHELLHQALHVTLAPSPAIRLQRWEELFKKLFDPLELSYVQSESQTVTLEQDGVAMTLPAIAEIPALRISYPWAGRSLFSLRALETAMQIVKFVEEAESSRQAYDRGVLEERIRIAQDLHDDVGARLLSGLHSTNSDLRSTIQGAMADIRSIVKGISGERVLLADLLADLRSESLRRLQPVGIELVWDLSDQTLPLTVIDYQLFKTLNSVIREIVSNCIKHALAKKLEVKVHVVSHQLHIHVKDDGKGFPEQALKGASGFGLKSMNKRVNDLGGKFEITNTPHAAINIFLPIMS